ncbi:hypothetical protein [Methylobacterium nigriterrae]|uniref:hypothetical protein n=1 Tax=Methylobacterium nigriterrae TaxID=3127512 RepID=UPI003013A679
MSARSPAVPASRIDPRVVLWLAVAVSAATLFPLADILGTIDHLRVRDPDDAMRLAGVRDLMAGQGWFDNTQHRFLPPAGVPSHWSRLVDAPLAGLILALTPLVGRHLAEGLTAAFWPPVLLGAYALILHAGMRGSLGPRAAACAVLAGLQTIGVTVQFAPGRVDHHNLQLVAMLGLGFCILRGGARAGALAGVLAAISLAIGLEGLPYLGPAALFLVADWVLRGRAALPALVGFGLGLGLAAPLLFAAQTAPALWTASACDALSPPWLWLAGGGLSAALACALLDARLSGPGSRLGLAALLGAGIGLGFAVLFPSCLGGPFPDMPDLVRERWLLTVNEMIPVPAYLARGQWEVLAFYGPLAAAALAAAWAAWRGPAETRRFALVACLFLWPGLVLGWVQFRGTYLASGFVPLVAGPALERAAAGLASAQAALRARIGGCLLAASLLSPAWVAAVSAAALIGEPEAAPDGSACQSHAAVAPLAALPPGTVLALVRMGPAILLHTPHSVVAAPYHRASAGLRAAIEGLGGSEADLRRHVAARGATYLVACPGHPAADLGAEPAFATRLAAGTAAADWLEPVPVAGTNLKIWRVLEPTRVEAAEPLR